MKITKRLISMLLALTLLVGMYPVNVQAEENQATVENGNTTIEGTNGFGNLLSQDLQDEQAAQEEDYSGGYNVIGLTIEENIATVEYCSMEEAVLVVALYTEDGLKLLLSGNTLVDPENTVATVELEGAMPEYFMASAYLLDTFDYSPLCSAYDTPMYTKEMQDLLNSTTDDYDQNKILNLDNSKETNFAVFAETTKVITFVEGVNTVISANDETLTYVIGNADENITGLQVGDVVAYTYGEDQILIVKVATITIDGTTVTLTGSELEMEEVFSHVKMESAGDTEDLTVDEATGDEGISYVGKITDEAAVMALSDPYAVNPADSGEISGKVSLGFKLEKESGSITLKGSLTLDAKVEFSYYISTSRQYVEFKVNVNTALTFEISGKASFPVLKVPSLGFSPVPGVYIGFEPQLVLEFTAKISASFEVGFIKGFSYENGAGITDLSTSPKIDFSPEIEGTIFFGIDMAPHVSLLNGWLAKFTFSALSGIELKAEMGGTDYEDVQIIGGRQEPESIHSCEACLSVELYGKTEFSIKLDFLKFINLSFKLSDTKFSIGECYYSLDQSDFGWGSCPNKSYHITVYVQNAQGQDAFGVDVIAGWAEQLTEIPLGKTNSNGVIEYYLQAGTYTFMATVDGEKLGKMVSVEEACKVTLDRASIGGMPTFISGIINPDLITDNGIVASGQCGANGADVSWTLYGSGLLNIAGSGDMATFSSTSKIPWYNYATFISKVVIDEGVASIGSRAFNNCTNLSQVDLPESILTIGSRAFYKCTSLSEIEIPPAVTVINSYTFYDCTNLRKVVLHENITSIKERAFTGCESLSSITIPSKTEFFGFYAFFNCDSLSKVYISDMEAWCNATFDGYYSNPVNNQGNLYLNGVLVTSITLPDSITIVNDYLFHGCSSIKKVVIPEGVTEIGTSAFESCDNLTTVLIPDTVTTIGGYAFCGSGITSLVIPDGVQKIPDLLCQWCESLTSVIVGKNVSHIGVHAFALSGLKEIFFRGDVPTTIERGAFLLVNPTRYYPLGNATWTSFIDNYNGNITWVPYAPASSPLDALADTQNLRSTDVESALNDEYWEQCTEDSISFFSVWEGEYGTEITEQYTLKTASFTGLVPGEQYLLLALVSIETDSILASENLLYIDQDVAAEDGTLTFTYAQRELTNTSYVMACGASHNNLKDAVITFPEMAAREEIQTVEPTVVFDGKTLVEGVDYAIVGMAAYTAAGTYTCYIRGIYNYSGTVKCTYTVGSPLGDIDSNGTVDCNDAIYLLLSIMFGEENYPLNGAGGDIDGNGTVNQEDAVYLLLHTLFGEDFYPLVPTKANPLV